MKDLMSKKHYFYEIYALLITGSAYPPSIDTPPLYGLPPHFYKKILIPPSMICQKFQPPINKGGGGFTL